MKRFLSYTAVADKLGCARQTVRRMVYDGTLPTVRIGRRVLVDEHKLYEYLNANSSCSK